MTAGVWALAAASLAYWALKFVASPPPVAAAPVVSAAAAADPLAVAKLLGTGQAASTAAPAPVSMASRFALVGVIAARSHAGTALIAMDGKPARAYRVGSKVDEGLVLQSVAPRKAMLGAPDADAPAFTLELPAVRR